MSRVLPAGAGLAVTALLALPAVSQAQASAGKPDAGGMPAPTVALERGRTVYVLNTCHFCHGVDLTKATMGAAELMRSALVGADDRGNVIGPIVRAGIPNLQTSMPSYPDLTAQEVEDLAAYIHYLRQVGRHRELTAVSLSGGDAAAGGRAFGSKCASCHAGRADKALSIADGDAGRIKTRFLGAPPPAPDGTDRSATGRRQHLKLIEQLSETDMNDLVAYLQQAASHD
jgi:mono/diheme cytochrome c family protein